MASSLDMPISGERAVPFPRVPPRPCTPRCMVPWRAGFFILIQGVPGSGNGAWSSGALYVVLSLGVFFGFGLLNGLGFGPAKGFLFFFDLYLERGSLSTSEPVAASGSSLAPGALTEGPDASCGGNGLMDPSVSLSTAPSTSSFDGWVVVVVACEPVAGVALKSVAGRPTTEFPGSSVVPLAKAAELAWSTAVVVADF